MNLNNLSKLDLYKSILRILKLKIQETRLNLPQPLVILGDASSSMNIAIQTSGIMTSLLCSISGATLHLFNGKDIIIDKPPSTPEEAITFAKELKARVTTSPSSSLFYFYEKKIKVNTFIVITDEEENSGYAGAKSIWTKNYFAPLFKRYYNEVNPAKVIFISFTGSGPGYMEKFFNAEFKNSASEILTVYKMNTRNPDLNKMDFILEQLSV